MDTGWPEFAKLISVISLNKKHYRKKNYFFFDFLVETNFFELTDHDMVGVDAKITSKFHFLKKLCEVLDVLTLGGGLDVHA